MGLLCVCVREEGREGEEEKEILNSFGILNLDVHRYGCKQAWLRGLLCVCVHM